MEGLHLDFERAAKEIIDRQKARVMAQVVEANRRSELDARRANHRYDLLQAAAIQSTTAAQTAAKQS